MASKPLQYVVVERKITFGKHAGKIMKIAQPSGRQRIPFRRFCDEVARSTSFTRQEVEAMINYATEIAKDFVTNGDMVDFGDLGTLVPSFKSRAVGQEEKFNPNIHIEKPMVHLRPSKSYFTLTGMYFKQVPKKTKKSNQTS